MLTKDKAAGSKELIRSCLTDGSGSPIWECQKGHKRVPLKSNHDPYMGVKERVY